jgi:predicted nucleic acid-binding protein
MANVYLDSCMVISLIEGDSLQRQTLKKPLFNQSIYSSELVRLETRLLAIRNNQSDSLEKFDRFFAACEIIPLNRAVFELATMLRAKHQLKTPDALHLAAAVHAGCHEFWTDDKQLITIASQYLQVLDWMKLENQTSKDDLD